MFSLRRCKRKKLIYQLQQKFHEEMPIITFEPRAWWVARCTDTNNPAGYCAINLYEYDNCSWMSVSGVFQKYRGHGLQKRMIKARVNYSLRNNIENIYTYTLLNNYPSSNSLISCGFRTCEPPAKHYGRWAGVRDIIYWKYKV